MPLHPLAGEYRKKSGGCYPQPPQHTARGRSGVLAVAVDVISMSVIGRREQAVRPACNGVDLLSAQFVGGLMRKDTARFFGFPH